MKNLKTILIILLFGSVSASYAQCDEDLLIQSQTDVDEFVAANSGSCNSLTDLIIASNVDLSGLSFITRITGTLNISANLSSFEGLNNVQTIGTLDVNNTVSSFESFESLHTIDFLIMEFFILPPNTVTIDLTGLESVTTLNQLYMSNTTITSFNALRNVATTSMSRMFIINCSGIQNINAFNSVTEVTGNFTINSNPDLQSVNGFNNLETVTDLQLSYNPLLTSINGFSSLISAENLQLWQNSMLNDCCVLFPLLSTNNPNNYSIFNNASDCTNANAVINYCGAITDSDSDGIADGIDNCIITANNNQSDVDNDGIGDACDDDIDGDGIPNKNDNCPDIPNSNQADANNDGIGDSCATQSGTGTGSFGVGTNMPVSKFQVTEGDVFIDNQYRGIIMKTADGRCFRYRPDATGKLVGKRIMCPN